MGNNKISYTERDFVGLRTDLLTYVKEQYPELINLLLLDLSVTVFI